MAKEIALQVVVPLWRQAHFLRRWDLQKPAYDCDICSHITLVTEILPERLGEPSSHIIHNNRMSFVQSNPQFNSFYDCGNLTNSSNIGYHNERNLFHINKLYCLRAIALHLQNTTPLPCPCNPLECSHWIWWLDEDAVILDSQFDPRNILPHLASKFFVIGIDQTGINTGSMFFRLSDQTVAFLDEWISLAHQARFMKAAVLSDGKIPMFREPTDQPPLIEMWNQHLPECKRQKLRGLCLPVTWDGMRWQLSELLDRAPEGGLALSPDENRLAGIQIIPQFWCNSIVRMEGSPMYTYMYGDPVVHFIGYPTTEKQRLLELFAHGDRKLIPRF